MKAKAVIGSGFGDEGKGRVVDFLSDAETMVVRFNGGANAGHTVQADGVRRVFHHFGSGSLKGASTFLSDRFIVNPMLFLKEKQLTPTYIHAECYVTTPFDMIVNQAKEKARGNGRHGSCGVGINETVERNQTFMPTHLREMGKLSVKACREYSIARLPDNEEHDKWASLIMDDELLDNYWRAFEKMKKEITIVENYGLFKDVGSLIFEGAQGLLLDEHHHYFPHVTRSRTGLTNVREICEPLGIEIEPIYVMRTYMTRHGQGPFPTEVKGMSFKDETNVSNEWQGSLRFGELNVLELSKAIRRDAGSLDACLAVTCLDQRQLNLEPLEDHIGFPVKFVSYGPERADMKERSRELSPVS